MFSYGKTSLLPRRFRLVLASFLDHPGLPFADAVTEETIDRAFDQEEVSFGDDEDAVYTPAMTLWAFLSQVLFKKEQRSCVAAVARVSVLLVALQREPCSCNTGAYCRARAKLSQKAIRQIATDVADGCERQVDESWLWHQRHVYLVDGTTVSMPDTPENQEAYPQSRTQQPGLGFDHFEVRGWRSIHRHMALTQVSHLYLNKMREQLIAEEQMEEESGVFSLPSPRRHSTHIPRRKPYAQSDSRCPGRLVPSLVIGTAWP